MSFIVLAIFDKFLLLTFLLPPILNEVDISYMSLLSYNMISKFCLLYHYK